MASRFLRVQRRAALLVVLIGFAAASEKQMPFMLRVVDAKFTFRPTTGPNNYSNCVLVMPDGRFYLLLGRQEIIGGSISLEGFQGSLDEKAVQNLRGVLDQQTITEAPSFEHPTAPYGADEFETFEVQINRGSTLQRVGYFKWNGERTRER